MATETLSRLRIEPRPEFADILREEPFARTPTGGDSAAQINRAFDRLVLQSGTRLSAAVVLRLCLLAAVTAGGSTFVLCENLLATAIAASVGSLVPVAILALRRARRCKKLSEQFPVLVERIVRSMRRGDELEPFFKQLANHSPSPLGDELRIALARTQLGLTLAEALKELPARTGLPETQVLVSAIAVSERAGGDLSASLEQLAHRLRERANLNRRLEVRSAADRGWSVLVLSVQAMIIAILVLAVSNQFSGLSVGLAGIAPLAIAGAALLVGGYWILRLISPGRKV
jgi:tight adherence protein B